MAVVSMAEDDKMEHAVAGVAAAAASTVAVAAAADTVAAVAVCLI